MRRICVVSGNRSDYARLKAIMAAIQAQRDLELTLLVIGAHLLPDFGTTVEQIRRDGFPVFATARTIIEGEDPASMSKSIGLGVMELTTLFDAVAPDIVVISGDRFEILSAAVAASAMNIRLAHLQGGEVTGTFDESVRHSVTKLAHLHFPATEGARERIIRMGEAPEQVHLVGCPSIDIIAKLPEVDRARICGTYRLDPIEPFLIVVQHPVTTEFQEAGDQMCLTLQAVEEVEMQGVMIYPNVDAGSERMVRAIRHMEQANLLRRIHKYKHVPFEDFVHLMRHAAAIVGNSSAAIREGSFLGTPAVNVGTRQHRRERGKNVLDVSYDTYAIREAILQQVDHGPYPSDRLYGDGAAAPRVAQILSTSELGPLQKALSY
ncbi:MAG: UDP-N-acetylglucosamine 2-epimerase (hydrolyzing) [candidate division NC10 bacterium]|nr:UDP-N-acetylglucosamine 2-epimerase (hydrolyzing) [candidate division NC10 bacterium]